MSKGNEEMVKGIGMYPVFFFPFIIQPLCPFLYFRLTSFVSVSPCLGFCLSWMDDADIPLAVSLHHFTSMLSFSFARLLPKCALLHWEPFDVNGNSWLRDIWWKVSRPVFTWL